jgi:hypothetical protein
MMNSARRSRHSPPVSPCMGIPSLVQINPSPPMIILQRLFLVVTTAFTHQCRSAARHVQRRRIQREPEHVLGTNAYSIIHEVLSLLICTLAMVQWFFEPTHDGPNISPTLAGRKSPLIASANLGLCKSGIELTNSRMLGAFLNVTS